MPPLLTASAATVAPLLGEGREEARTSETFAYGPLGAGASYNTILSAAHRFTVEEQPEDSFEASAPTREHSTSTFAPEDFTSRLFRSHGGSTGRSISRRRELPKAVRISTASIPPEGEDIRGENLPQYLPGATSRNGVLVVPVRRYPNECGVPCKHTE